MRVLSNKKYNPIILFDLKVNTRKTLRANTQKTNHKDLLLLKEEVLATSIIPLTQKLRTTIVFERPSIKKIDWIKSGEKRDRPLMKSQQIETLINPLFNTEKARGIRIFNITFFSIENFLLGRQMYTLY